MLSAVFRLSSHWPGRRFLELFSCPVSITLPLQQHTGSQLEAIIASRGPRLPASSHCPTSTDPSSSLFQPKTLTRPYNARFLLGTEAEASADLFSGHQRTPRLITSPRPTLCLPPTAHLPTYLQLSKSQRNGFHNHQFHSTTKDS